MEDVVNARLLFGGAIQAAFPDRFQDVSAIREVPDNQEVFTDPNRDESIIVELLERKEDVSDEESAKWFLLDLAREQESGPGTVIQSTAIIPLLDSPAFDESIFRSYAIGNLEVAKGRQGPESRNLIRCYLANFRLRAVSTDLLIILNEPIFINQQSESARLLGPGATIPASVAQCLSAMDVFKMITSSIRILDWTLFGSS